MPRPKKADGEKLRAFSTYLPEDIYRDLCNIANDHYRSAAAEARAVIVAYVEEIRKTTRPAGSQRVV